MRIFPTEAGRSLTARLVGVAELADPAVAGPAVGDDPSARLDGVGDEAVQRRRGSVRHDLHPAAAVPTRFGDLNGHSHQGFLALGASAGQARLLPADVGL